MNIVNILEAKTHLSRLVEEASKGETFIIAKAGRPMVKVVPLEAEERKVSPRLGFMRGEFTVPDDFNTMDADVIERMFYGDE